MKRLIKSEKYIPNKGDYVMWKRHPYDDTTYEIVDVLEDGTVMMDNGVDCFTGIKPSVIEKI